MNVSCWAPCPESGHPCPPRRKRRGV